MSSFIRNKAKLYKVTFHDESIWYSTNVWMATALYNFLESLWIYNAHQFVPITPLDHGHLRNRTFSVSFGLLFALAQKLLAKCWLEYWLLIQEHVLLSTSGSHSKPTMQPDINKNNRPLRHHVTWRTREYMNPHS